jgi:hypothetical protein
MKFVAIVCGFLSVLSVSAQAGEIFDMSGKRVFYTEDTGETIERVSAKGVRTSYKVIRFIHEPTGQSFTYNPKWDQTTSDGELVMDYVFNARHWNWVGGTGVTPCQDKSGLFKNCMGASDNTKRTYEVEDDVYTSPDQGDVPLLTFKDGTYLDEFGEAVFTLDGGLATWSVMVMLHYYYEQTYNPETMASIDARRAVATAEALESNGIATDMVALGHKYNNEQWRIFGPQNEVHYFTQVEGKYTMLDEEQVLRLKDKWLILNEKTWRRAGPPHHLPQGGFLLSNKEVKKLGISAEKHHVMIQIKIKPEFVADFQAAMSE